MSIILDHISYVYGGDTPLEVRALDDVCLQIPDGQFVGIIGHTGSGKSTLVQHMNGLTYSATSSMLCDTKRIVSPVSVCSCLI